MLLGPVSRAQADACAIDNCLSFLVTHTSNALVFLVFSCLVARRRSLRILAKRHRAGVLEGTAAEPIHMCFPFLRQLGETVDVLFCGILSRRVRFLHRYIPGLVEDRHVFLEALQEK